MLGEHFSFCADRMIPPYVPSPTNDEPLSVDTTGETASPKPRLGILDPPFCTSYHSTGGSEYHARR